ncbi:hypothetical protein LU293_08085 [Moraxella nasovis]|nr:hypothetical protein [Moraxella nasovis]UNU73032.1 hypothetical protein LU293_08085 [Moraxella nasovis]
MKYITKDIEFLPRPANLSVKGFCLRALGISIKNEWAMIGKLVGKWAV